MEEQFINSQPSNYVQNSNSSNPLLYDLSPLNLQPSQSTSSNDPSQVLFNSPSMTSPFSNNFNLFFPTQQQQQPTQQNSPQAPTTQHTNSLDPVNSSQEAEEDEEFLDEDFSEGEESSLGVGNSSNGSRPRSSSTNSARRFCTFFNRSLQ